MSTKNQIMGVVAIVGRPNVGKSSLFNQLVRAQRSIVHDRPGVTRDKIYATCELTSGEKILFIDTGGFEDDKSELQPFSENLVWMKTESAIDEADTVLFVVDGLTGIVPEDKILASILRKKDKQVLLVVNKLDGLEKENLKHEFFALGFGDPLAVSAAHRRGFDDLGEALYQQLENVQSTRKYATEVGRRIAIIGRPNVGKSSIINRLANEDRSLVSDIAGTTRDSIDSPVKYNNKTYWFVDTAGIRRRSRLNDTVEIVSVARAIENIERSDLVVLVLDASQEAGGVTDQDIRLADLAISRYRPLLVVINKWDKVEKTDKTAQEYEKHLRIRFGLLKYVPIIFVSCKENLRVFQIFDQAERLLEQAARRVDTSKLNEVLTDLVQTHTPSIVKNHGKRIKFYYATQTAILPPTIVVFCNVSKEISEGYQRYLSNKFKERLGFEEVPIKLHFRSKSEQSRRRGRERGEVESVQ